MLVRTEACIIQFVKATTQFRVSTLEKDESIMFHGDAKNKVYKA